MKQESFLDNEPYTMEQLKKEFYDRFGGLGGVNPRIDSQWKFISENFVPVEAIVRQGVPQPVLLAEINELLKEQQKIADIYKEKNYHPYSQGQEFGKLFAYKKIQQLILSKQSA